MRPLAGRFPQRLSTHILTSMITILVASMLVGFTLFTYEERAQLDRQYEHQALAIAHTVAQTPEIQQAMEYQGSGDLVEVTAERMRQASDASYIVVIDMDRVRHSHPIPALIGRKVEESLVTRPEVGIDNGSLGRSANAKVPLYGPTGLQVGEVSAGIRERDVTNALWRELPAFALWAALALALGAAASYVLAWRLKRRTFGLELEEIATLLQEREAMLHGIKEGVIAFDRSGRVTIVNDEARRLLGLPGSGLGQPLDDLLPEGRLRSVLAGTADDGRPDVPVLTDDHYLTVNRRPVTLGGRELGAVVTLRDRTELSGLLRELDSVRGLTDALRAQQHEFANRMHTVAGLLELGEHAAALSYLTDLQGDEAALSESLRERIANPLVVGLILAKSSVAAERGVHLTLTGDSWLGDAPPHVQALLTVLGNLIDNAVEATAGRPDARVTVRLTDRNPGIALTVSDTGPGIPPGSAATIFQDGYSTNPRSHAVHRGLGLAIVHRLIHRIGGTIEVSEGPGAVFSVTLPSAEVPVP